MLQRCCNDATLHCCNRAPTRRPFCGPPDASAATLQRFIGYRYVSMLYCAHQSHLHQSHLADPTWPVPLGCRYVSMLYYAHQSREKMLGANRARAETVSAEQQKEMDR